MAVDDIAQAETISQAATAAGVTVGILVEVDIGMGRCGVAPGEPALALARAIMPLEGLRFDGIQAYEGHAVYVDDPAERSRWCGNRLTRPCGLDGCSKSTASK